MCSTECSDPSKEQSTEGDTRVEGEVTLKLRAWLAASFQYKNTLYYCIYCSYDGSLNDQFVLYVFHSVNSFLCLKQCMRKLVTPDSLLDPTPFILWQNYPQSLLMPSHIPQLGHPQSPPTIPPTPTALLWSLKIVVSAHRWLYCIL